MTFRSFAQEWLQEMRLSIQRSTWEAYTVYVNVHLVSYFGRYRLSDITSRMISSYINEKLQKGRSDGRGGLSEVSIRKHLSILKQILSEATNKGIIEHNPALTVRRPRMPRAREYIFLAKNEARALLSGLTGDMKLIVMLALYYGLRKSEVLGLRWCSVDFNKNTLSVNHTVVKNLTIEAKDSTKKPLSRRTYQLLPEIREALKERFIASCDMSSYIFSREDGSPLRPDTVLRQFQRCAERLGFDKMRFHDLRHSCASILFDEGWSLEDVKNWLGHSDIETTSNIYLHYSAARKVLKAESLSGLLI